MVRGKLVVASVAISTSTDLLTQVMRHSPVVEVAAAGFIACDIYVGGRWLVEKLRRPNAFKKTTWRVLESLNDSMLAAFAPVVFSEVKRSKKRNPDPEDIYRN